MARVTTAVATAAMQVRIDREAVGDAAVDLHIHIGREGGGVIKRHGEVDDTSGEAKAASRTLLGPLAAEDMAELAHVALNGGDGAVHRDIREANGDDSIRWVPPMDQGTPASRPGNPLLEA